MRNKVLCLIFLLCIVNCAKAQYSWEKYVYEESGKKRLVIHGIKGRLYDKIIYVKFSQDGTRVAYTVKQDGKLLMVIDSVEEEYQNVLENSIAFSVNGKRLVFVAKKDKKWYVIVDENPETQIYDDKSFKLLEFSPDEKRISYAVAKDYNSGWNVITDGKEDGLNYRDIINNRFSPNSQHTAYVGCKKNINWVVVVDGKEGKIEMDKVADFTPVFSPNSKHLVYGGSYFRHTLSPRCFIVIDSTKSIECEHIGKGSPVFSITGDSVGFMAFINKKWNMIINNKIIGERNYTGNNHGFWSLKIIEDYFSIQPEDRCPIIVNNFESSSGFLIKVNTYSVPYPDNGGYILHTDILNQAKLENGMNFIGINYETGLFDSYSDFKCNSFDGLNCMNIKFYFNAHTGKVYTIKTGTSGSEFLTYINLGKKYIGVIDITESYLRETLLK
jgi:hypothetical protein